MNLEAPSVKNPRAPYAAITGTEVCSGLEFEVHRFSPDRPKKGYEVEEYGVFSGDAEYDVELGIWVAKAQLAYGGIAQALEAEQRQVQLSSIGVVSRSGQWQPHVLTIPAGLESF